MASYRVCKDETLDDVTFNCSSWEWVEVPITLGNLTENQVSELLTATIIVLAVAFGFRFLFNFILNKR